MIEHIEREDTGPSGALALSVEDAGGLSTEWSRSELVFAWATAAIALHLVDARAAHPTSTVSATRILEAVLTITLAWSVIRLFRRSGRSVRVALALGIGSWATIAGLALTVGRIWKVGPEGTYVTGLASLVAGALLLGTGTATLLAAARGWRKLLAIPIAVAAVAYLFAPLTIAVFMTHVPPTMLGGRTPADEGFAYRDVTLTTEDGIRLSGWYVPSRNRAAVVLVHGSGSSRLNILDHLRVLADAGYGVLALDARGHGASDGVAMDLGWMTDRDIDAGVSYLARRGDVDPERIGAVGVSMGGIGALTAAAADPRIAGVVAEGVAVHSFPDALVLGPAEWSHLPFYWVALTAIDLLSPAAPPMPVNEAIEAMGSRPVLLISGRGHDEGILNRRFAEAGPGTELLEFPDTKHSQGIWWHTDAWRRRVVGFLDGALLDR